MTVEASTLSVHRCRFVDFAPSAVTALAFPPLPLPSPKRKRTARASKAQKFGTLAVGRANGNIELCQWTGAENDLQAPQAWVVSKTISGHFSSKVDSLAFTLRHADASPDETPALSDLRLFSAGGGNELAEWDIERGCIRRTAPSQGGSIWCISPNPASTLLAIGCEDGAVRLFSLEHDSLIPFKRFDKVKSRILSIAWGPPVPPEASINADLAGSDEEDEEEWKDSWLVAGCSDSSVRKWDFATGRITDRMGTDKMRGERTLVWAVNVLGDGTIVSGDSLGMVKFWDSNTCTQLQTFQAHGADVLCLATSPDGTVIYSSGVDQKVIQFSHVKTQSSNAGGSSLLSRSSSKWVQSVGRRLHSHDVRALAIWPPYSPLPPAHRRQFPLDVAPVLASGGLDMSVVVTPAALPSSTATKVINPLSTSHVATFEDSYHRRLAYSSGPCHASALHLARRARLLLCQKDSGVSVWRISEKQPDREDQTEEEDGPPRVGGWEPVLDMDLNVHTNLVASSISDDGKWLAVSDWYQSKLFRLEALENGQIKPKRIRDFHDIIQSHLPGAQGSTGASTFVFTPDSSKLVIGTSMTAYVLVLDLSAEKPRVLRRFEQHRMRNVVLGQRIVKGRSRSRSVPPDVDMADADAEAENNDDAAVDKKGPEESDSDAEMDDETLNPTSKPLTATITRMAVSPDGQWLATSDDHRRTHVFNLDSIQHHCVLPSFPQSIHALTFNSSSASSSILVLGLADNSIQVYDVESRTFPAWARELTRSIPLRFKHLHDPIIGVTFDSSQRGAGALFWGATWLCRVQLNASVGYGGFDKKRRWGGQRLDNKPRAIKATGMNAIELGEAKPSQAQQENFKIVTHYRPILFADFIGPAELVVVERPLVDVLAKLPPAFFKPKYGAT